MTGHGKFLFPSTRSLARCMSENTICAALRRMGIGKDETSAHGFRAAASSMLFHASDCAEARWQDPPRRGQSCRSSASKPASQKAARGVHINDLAA
jgi:hypothetical protein